ncbi:MAG: hypothetical protein GX053_05190 [Tissierella sp.]|nr:hypothetical protein [Tissierella sp.]
MEIKLLKQGYKDNEQFYKDFLDDQIKNKEEYFTDEVIYIAEEPDFPIYMAKGSEKEKKELFLKAFDVISSHYLDTDRDTHFDELFWHSLLTVYKREYLLEEYPEIKDSISKFKNIVIKNFDWENYIYKCVIGTQYINDNVIDPEERKKYYELIIDNMDIYNYIIKSEIFRNDNFLINILDIINDWGLSKILKAKIKDRDDLGKDERIGRRVIFEFNKSYPIILSPMLEKEELEELFIEYLGYYYDGLKLESEI